MRRIPPGSREVLFEFRPVGNSVRVAALDPETRTEVIIIADPRATDEQVKREAARKLFYVLEKKRKAQEQGGS